MNDGERTRERMRELGRLSGKARRAKRSRGFLEALRDLIDADPEKAAARLMSTGAGAVAAIRVLEATGQLGPTKEDGSGEIVVQSAFGMATPDEAAGFADLVRLAYSTGQAALMGLPTTPDELAALLELEGDDAPEKSRNPASSGS